MTFLLRVTSLLLWPITIRFIVHITPLSIISPPFHHPLLLSPCTPDRLMFSYKMEETCITFIDVGFEPLQIRNHMRNIAQTKCLLHRLWCLTTAQAIRQQSCVMPVSLHVVFLWQVVNFRVGSNSCTGHFIFYGKVHQCDLPVSQRLTKNSLLQGESVALQRQPETPHLHNALYGCDGKKIGHFTRSSLKIETC